MDYRRQRAYKRIEKIDEILKEKHVAIVGMGALGSHNSELITRMGIGKLTIIDFDKIEENNLCKTNLYLKEDVGSYKVDVAKEKLEKITEETKIIAKAEKIKKENINKLLEGVDLILDGTDNLATRLIISDYSQEKDIPWVYAAVDGSYGSVIAFVPREIVCFRCALNIEGEEHNSQERNVGIIIPTVSITTSYQVTEALKILCEKNKDVVKEERLINIYDSNTSYFPLKKNKNCTCMEV